MPIESLASVSVGLITQSAKSLVEPDPDPDSGSPRTTAQNWALVGIMLIALLIIIVLGAIIEKLLARFFPTSELKGHHDDTGDSPQNFRTSDDEERNTHGVFEDGLEGERRSVQERQLSLQTKKSDQAAQIHLAKDLETKRMSSAPQSAERSRRSSSFE